MSLINVHAPTEEKDESEKEAFYQKVEETYDSCPSNDINIVLGDWNAKVGKEDIYQGLVAITNEMQLRKGIYYSTIH